MGLIDVPSDQRHWERVVSSTLRTDGSKLDISYFGWNAFGSASKVEYADWLLLRACWQVKENIQITHESIFDPSQSSKRRAKSLSLVQAEPWWRALVSLAQDPWDWGYMAAWRQTLLDINEVRDRSTQLGSRFQHLDLEPIRLVCAPGTSQMDLRRSSRQPTERYARQRSEREQRNEAVDRLGMSSGDESRKSSTSSSSQDSSPSQSSGRGSGGSLSRGAKAASDDFGLDIESRQIMRDRPDEALINMSLVLLLQGVATVLRKDPIYKRYNWSTLHKKFTVSQPVAGEGAVAGERRHIMTAKTDGCLQFIPPGSTAPPESLAIIEVKPFRRWTNTSCATAIQVQESAEMAAWISTESNHGHLPSKHDRYRRLLVSQDFDQVFVTIAEYDDLYVRHIRGDDLTWTMDRTPNRETSPSLRGQQRRAQPSPGPLPASPPRTPAPVRGGPSAAAQSLPVRQAGPPPRGRVSPQTPIRQAAAASAPVPGAPGPSRGMPPNLKRGTEGFLVMHEFRPFELQKPRDLQELTVLMVSLTRELCDYHRALRTPDGLKGPR